MDSTWEEKQGKAETACGEVGGTWTCIAEEMCSTAYSDPSYCSGYDPGDDITLFAGVYYVDGGLVGQVFYDLSLVFNCGRPSTVLLSGGFELDGLDAGETLYELGLRNGDIPVELNGWPLATYEEVVEALVELYIGEGETSYELDILRNSTFMTLEYQFVFTS